MCNTMQYILKHKYHLRAIDYTKEAVFLIAAPQVIDDLQACGRSPIDSQKISGIVVDEHEAHGRSRVTNITALLDVFE